MIDKIPAELHENISNNIQQLNRDISKEATDAFIQFIDQYGEDKIYALTLYFSGDSWSYIMPSLATEKGLDYVTAQYIKNSPVPEQLQKQTLRWSPCDSPYHDSPDLEEMMPATTETLDTINEHIEQASELLMSEEDDDAFENSIEIYRIYHELVYATVMDALKSIAQNPIIKAYCSANNCVVCLNAGDWSEEHFIADIETINGAEITLQIKQQLQDATAAYDATRKLWDEKVEADRLNPPTTNLTVDDFVELFDKFNPEFTMDDGMVLIQSSEEPFKPYTLMSLQGHNRFNLMELIEDSPHYEELDRLFGHFLGVNFKSDDLLVNIAREYEKKIAEKIQHQYPDYSFYTYLVVDRMESYRIGFYRNDQNGYTAHYKYRDAHQGVFESHCYGPLTPTVIFPVGLFQDQGNYFVQVLGLSTPELLTTRSLHKNVLLGGSDTSFDEAMQHAKDILLEHLDIAYQQGKLQFDEVVYPDDFIRHEETLGIPANAKDFAYIQEWRELEVQPEFIKHGLITIRGQILQ